MYKPVITVVQKVAHDIEEMIDNQILLEVQTHIDVNKEELLKALAYDRDQYHAGYKDGASDTMKAFCKRGHWKEISADEIYGSGSFEPAAYACTCCGFDIDLCDEYNFCPNCGADMRGECKCD